MSFYGASSNLCEERMDHYLYGSSSSSCKLEARAGIPPVNWALGSPPHFGPHFGPNAWSRPRSGGNVPALGEEHDPKKKTWMCTKIRGPRFKSRRQAEDSFVDVLSLSTACKAEVLRRDCGAACCEVCLKLRLPFWTCQGDVTPPWVAANSQQTRRTT